MIKIYCDFCKEQIKDMADDSEIKITPRSITITNNENRYYNVCPECINKIKALIK